MEDGGWERGWRMEVVGWRKGSGGRGSDGEWRMGDGRVMGVRDGEMGDGGWESVMEDGGWGWGGGVGIGRVMGDGGMSDGWMGDGGMGMKGLVWVGGGEDGGGLRMRDGELRMGVREWRVKGVRG